MHTDAFNHQPADMLLFAGICSRVGRPWVPGFSTGSVANRELPGFVVLTTGKSNMSQAAQWSNGFLPSTYQGVMFRRKGDPVLYLSNPSGVTRTSSAPISTWSRSLNREHYTKTGDAEIASRISSYEMAFRMQMSTPELLDLSKESGPAPRLVRPGPGDDPRLRDELPAGAPDWSSGEFDSSW